MNDDTLWRAWLAIERENDDPEAIEAVTYEIHRRGLHDAYEPNVQVRTEQGFPPGRAVQIVAVRDPAQVTDESIALGTIKLIAVTGLLVISALMAVWAIPVVAAVALAWAWFTLERAWRRHSADTRRLTAATSGGRRSTTA
jgi:uncharacterized membrane protein